MRTYTFKTIERCMMCGSGSGSHKVLGHRMDRSQGTSPAGLVALSVSVVRCMDCGLIFSNPQPVPANIQDHYGTPPEEYWKEEYFTTSPVYFGGQLDIVASLLGPLKGLQALDIGAGLGKAMLAMEEAGMEVYGVEPSIPFRDRAITRMGIDPAKLLLGSMEEVDFPERHFDFISFAAVFEHLYEPADCLAKAMRWLRPGGVIHIEIPSAEWLISKFLNTYFKFRGTSFVTHLSPMHAPFHLYEFTLKSFEALSKKLDFTIVHHDRYVCEVLLVPQVLHRPLTWYMERTGTGMQLVVYLKRKDEA